MGDRSPRRMAHALHGPFLTPRSFWDHQDRFLTSLIAPHPGRRDAVYGAEHQNRAMQSGIRQLHNHATEMEDAQSLQSVYQQAEISRKLQILGDLEDEEASRQADNYALSYQTKILRDGERPFEQGVRQKEVRNIVKDQMANVWARLDGEINHIEEKWSRQAHGGTATDPTPVTPREDASWIYRGRMTTACDTAPCGEPPLTPRIKQVEKVVNVASPGGCLTARCHPSTMERHSGAPVDFLLAKLEDRRQQRAHFRADMGGSHTHSDASETASIASSSWRTGTIATDFSLYEQHRANVRSMAANGILGAAWKEHREEDPENRVEDPALRNERLQRMGLAQATDDRTADRAAALMHRAYQKNAIERMATSMNLLDDVELTQSPEPKPALFKMPKLDFTQLQPSKPNKRTAPQQSMQLARVSAMSASDRGSAGRVPYASRELEAMRNRTEPLTGRPFGELDRPDHSLLATKHARQLAHISGSYTARAELTSSKMAEQKVKYEQVMDEIENSIEAHQRSLSTIDMDNMQLKHQINMLTPSPAPRNKPESRSNSSQPDQDKGAWTFKEGTSFTNSSRSVSFQESVVQAPPETHQQTAVRSAVSEVFARAHERLDQHMDQMQQNLQSEKRLPDGRATWTGTHYHRRRMLRDRQSRPAKSTASGFETVTATTNEPQSKDGESILQSKLLRVYRPEKSATNLGLLPSQLSSSRTSAVPARSPVMGLGVMGLPTTSRYVTTLVQSELQAHSTQTISKPGEIFANLDIHTAALYQ